MRYFETYRGVVAPADLDHLGHMNVEHYFRAVSVGAFQIFARLGLDARTTATRRLGFVVVHGESDFRRELHAGDLLVLESAVLEVGRKSARFHHVLRRVGETEIAFEARFLCVLLDLETRRAVPLPDDIRAAALAIGATEAV